MKLPPPSAGSARPPGSGRHRAGPLLRAAALALAAHAALLAPWLAAPEPPLSAGPRHTQALQVRQVPAWPAAAQAEPLQPPPRPAAPAAPRAPEQAASATQTPETQPASPKQGVGSPAALPATLPLQLAAQRWHYRLREAGGEGSAWLDWQPEAGSYTLSLLRERSGRPAEGWRSSGRLDAGGGGLSPERFVTFRRGSPRQSVNFRHEEGLLSYSASAETLALPPGVQDRLSAWLQIAALAAAVPQGLQPGLQLQLPIAGLRGAVPLWRFVVRQREDVVLADGLDAQPAWRLDGSPAGLAALRLELWLAPALSHLPVRIRMSWEGQESSELLLQAAAQP